MWPHYGNEELAGLTTSSREHSSGYWPIRELEMEVYCHRLDSGIDIYTYVSMDSGACFEFGSHNVLEQRLLRLMGNVVL